MQHCQHRGRLQRGAVVTVQHRLLDGHMDPLDQGRAPYQMGGMIRAVRFVHLPADDLAAEDIHDQIQIEKRALERGGQVGDIPTPDLIRLIGGKARDVVGPGYVHAQREVRSGTVTIATADTGSAVPVPAAVWLFGSGLLGLIGMARRKKA